MNVKKQNIKEPTRLEDDKRLEAQADFQISLGLEIMKRKSALFAKLAKL